MNQRVDALLLAQPGIERDIGVARWTARVVIAQLAIETRAAVGLQQNQHPATAQHRQSEILRRLAPCLCQVTLQARRQVGEPFPVARQRNLDVIDGARQQPLDIGRLPRFGADIVALAAQQHENLDDTRGCVEANGIAGTAAPGGIVGEYQRQPAVAARRGAESGPSRSKPRDIIDAIGIRCVMHAGKFEAWIDCRFGLERNGARQQPAVELGQDDVHRQIRGRKATRRAFPCLACAARQHDLQHRRIGGIEHGRLVLAQRRKGRGVQDHPGPALSDELRELVLDCRILETADSDAEGREPFSVESLQERLDGRHIRCHQIGAIENDHRRRTVVCGRPNDGKRADRPGWLCLDVAAQQIGGKTQRLAQVLRAARAKVGVEVGELVRGQGRDGSKARIWPVVARQCCEQHASVARQIADMLEPVAPVIETTQAAYDDEPGIGQDAIDIEIDRHRMPELLQAGEPQRRQQIGVVAPRRRQRREVAVRKGQDDDLRRRLAEVDGGLDLFETRQLGRQDVHLA